MWLLFALFLALPAAAQTSSNPQFRDKQVIPFFHRENPKIVYFQTLFRRAVSKKYEILIVLGGWPETQWQRDSKYRHWSKGDLLGIFRIDRTSPTRIAYLGSLRGEKGNCNLNLQRTDTHSLVIFCTGDYGMRHSFTKVFYDLAAGRMKKHVEFEPPSVVEIAVNKDNSHAVIAAADQTFRVRLDGGAPRIVNRLAAQNEPVWIHGCKVKLPPGWSVSQAALTSPQGKPYLLPQSTARELRSFRPRDHGIEIREEIGACQLVGHTLWLGVTFYNGEGMTGVGRIGQFNFKTRKYSFIHPRMLVDSATSALLLDSGSVWVGMSSQPEGAAFSRGLLRFNPETGEQRRYPVTEVIWLIKRVGDVVWMGTVNGLFGLEGERLTHYVIEPALTGGYEIKTRKSVAAGVLPKGGAGSGPSKP